MGVIKYFKKHPVSISIFILLFAFFLFYPTNHVTIDENSYISNATWISKGFLKQPCDPILPGQYEVDDYCIYKYNLGFSFLLAPLVLIYGELVYLSNFIFFALCIIVFKKILEHFEINPIFIYFFAFFPAFVFFSRTVLSEMSSMFMTLLMFYMFLKSSKEKVLKKQTIYLAIAGASFAIGVLIKYTSIVHLSSLILVLWYLGYFKAWSKSIIGLVLGALPFIALLLFLNVYLYEGITNSGYYYSDEQVFNLNYLIKHFLVYIIALSAFYPLMLPASFSVKKLRFLLIPVFMSIIVYSSSKNTLFEGRFLDLILGIRFLIPVIPLIFIPYFKKLNEYMKVNFIKAGIVVSIAILILTSISINFIHDKFVKEKYPEPWIKVSEYLELRDNLSLRD